MSTPLLFVVCGIYLYVAAEQMWRGNIIGGLVWLNYSCANACLLLLNK